MLANIHDHKKWLVCVCLYNLRLKTNVKVSFNS